MVYCLNSKSQLDYNLFREFGIRDNIMIIGVKSKFLDLTTFRSWSTLQGNIQSINGVISAYSVVDA